MYHQYANDIQLYLLKGGWPDTAPKNLAIGMEATAKWLKQSWLQWNLRKQRFCGGGDGNTGQGFQLLYLDGISLIPAPAIKKLRVILDAS